MAALVVAAVGAAVGSAALGAGVVALGMTGAQIGWLAGSMLASALFAPSQKSQGPRLSDLAVPSGSYGTALPYVVGAPRLAGQIIWASTRRELANTTSHGKGGGGSDFTQYTYDIDILIELSANEIQGVDQVFHNGKLIFNTSSDADAITLAASNNYDGWGRMTVYKGAADQLPDPVYEAAVGTANAVAYRGRGTVFIESLHLGSSGQLPVLTFRLGVGGNVLFLDTFTAKAGDASAIPIAAHVPDQAPAAFTPWVSNTVVGVQTSPFIAPEGTFVQGAAGGGTLGFATDVVTATVPPSGFLPAFPFKVGAKLQGSSVNLGVSNFAGFQSTFVGGHTVFMSVEVTPGQRRAVVTVQGAAPAYLVYSTPWVPLLPNAPYDFQVDFSEFSLVAKVDGNIISGANPVAFIAYGLMDVIKFALQHYDTDDAYIDSLYLIQTGSISNSLLNTVAALCVRAGLAASQFDVTGLASITRPVHALAVMPVPSMRSIIELLAGLYAFDIVLSDKLYFRARGGASVLSLAYDDIGWVASGSALPDPLPITQSNELEVPAQLALTYINIDNNNQPDTQYSDRLHSGQASTSAIEVPLGFTPQEAKQSVERMLLDQAWRLRTQITLGLQYTALEPGDVVTVTDQDGSSYRLRLMQRTETAGVLTFDAVIDDPSVLVQSGTTASGGSGGQTTVTAPANTVLALMDIPILRDVDNQAGHYYAMRGTQSNWFGGALFDSLDGTTYIHQANLATQAAIGTASSALGDWAGGNVFDMANSVTVTIAPFQQLASYSRDIILTGAAPGYLLGSEIFHALNATLVSAGVYTLSGLLRGRRGTEWAMPGHVAEEMFVELKPSGEGYSFAPLANANLGVLRHYKGVSSGQLLSAVSAQTLTPLGIGLKPFAPVDARADRATADTVLSWRRRTRLSTRMLGPLPITPPWGEASLAYEIDIYSSSAFATVVRTLSSSVPSCTYTAAQQATDGTSATLQHLRIYQISATVGRGYPLQASV